MNARYLRRSLNIVSFRQAAHPEAGAGRVSTPPALRPLQHRTKPSDCQRATRVRGSSPRSPLNHSFQGSNRQPPLPNLTTTDGYRSEPTALLPPQRMACLSPEGGLSGLQRSLSGRIGRRSPLRLPALLNHAGLVLVAGCFRSRCQHTSAAPPPVVPLRSAKRLDLTAGLLSRTRSKISAQRTRQPPLLRQPLPGRDRLRCRLV